MPRCYFDIKGAVSERDQYGLDCGSVAHAIDKADVLARTVGQRRPELLRDQYYISVIDSSGREVYRAPIMKPVPA
jgi:hypothetical protein